MMCAKCVNAGNAQDWGLPNMARTLHNQCLWPATCTCQHAVGGEWVNDSRTSGVPQSQG